MEKNRSLLYKDQGKLVGIDWKDLKSRGIIISKTKDIATSKGQEGGYMKNYNGETKKWNTIGIHTGNF